MGYTAATYASPAPNNYEVADVLDFVPSSGYVTFASGQTAATFNVEIQDDNLFEWPNEHFQVQLTTITYEGQSLPYQLRFATQTIADVEILDDKDAGEFGFAKISERYLEAKGTALPALAGSSTTPVLADLGERPFGFGDNTDPTYNVTIVREGATIDGQVTVYIDVVAEPLLGSPRLTASEGVDYELSTKALNFSAGQRNATFQVRISNDPFFEYPNEHLGIQITSIRQTFGPLLDVSFTINTLKNVMTAEIVDDGDSGRFVFESVGHSVGEGDGELVVNITRVGAWAPVAKETQVDFRTRDRGDARSGLDYERTQGRAIFPSFGCTAVSGGETVSVNGTFSPYSTQEGLQLVVSGEAMPSSGLFCPAMGRTGTNTRVQISVPILNDNVFEFPDEIFELFLENITYSGATISQSFGMDTLEYLGVAMNGAQHRSSLVPFFNFTASSTSARVTILDDSDAGTFQFRDSFTTVAENIKSGTHTVVIERLGHAASGAFNLTVVYNTGGNATYGVDYTSMGTNVSFDDQQRESTLTMSIINDDFFEYPNEVFPIMLTNATYLVKGRPVDTFEFLDARRLTEVEIVDDGDAGYIEFLHPAVGVTEQASGPGWKRVQQGTGLLYPSYYDLNLTLVRRGGRSSRIGVMYQSYSSDAVGGSTLNLTTAMKDVDYIPIEGIIYFEDQEVEKNLTVKVLDEQIFEATAEHVVVNISSLPEDIAKGFAYVGQQSSSEITITDLGDDAGIFEIQNSSYFVSEAATFVRVNLTRTAPANSDVMLNLSLSDGTAQFGLDYGTFINGHMGTSMIPFYSGETLKTVEIQILNDGTFELFDETFNVSIAAAFDFSGNRLPSIFFGRKSCTITIVDDGDAGTFRFEMSSMKIGEAASVRRVNVIREGQYASGAVRVDYETLDFISSATGGGVDYESTSGTLYFADKQRSAQFNVTVVNDEVFEYPDESIVLRLFNVRDDSLDIGLPRAITKIVESGGENVTVFTNETISSITIIDDYDAGRIAFASSTFAAYERLGQVGIVLVREEGSSSSLNVSVHAQEQTAGRGVDFMAEGDSNFTVLFAPSQRTAILNITYVNDDLYEYPNEIFSVSIHSVRATDFGDVELLGGTTSPSSAVATILDDGDAGQIQFVNATLSCSEDQGMINVQLSRTGGNSGDLTVRLISTGRAQLKSDFSTMEIHNTIMLPHSIDVVFSKSLLGHNYHWMRTLHVCQ